MKRHKKRRFLSRLKEVPIVSAACERTGLSRNTVYRWLKEDPEFKKALRRCLDFGRESINDLAESSLINLIQQNDLGAIRLWLGSNKDNYVRPMLPRHWKPIEQKKDLPDKVKVEIVHSREEIDRLKALNEEIKQRQQHWDERNLRINGNEQNKKPLDE